MGKASKWIKNFLMGKKEEKVSKERVVPPVLSFTGTSTAIVPSTPRVRRRWSFGRSQSKEIFQHKLCKSLDAMDASMLPVQLMIEYAKTRNISPWVASTEPCCDFRDTAATKIQAVFRAFLARKALCALRGLVKIQALVRGHLVRKQTTATLRCMHALMTIQVRARVQRIKMAEEEQAFATSDQRYHWSALNPSRLTEKSLVAHSSLRHCPSRTISSPKETIGQSIFYRTEFVNKMGDEQQQPSYMGNTKSSKAKERAQSEPKQRPNSGTREKGRKSVSIEETGVYLFAGKRIEDQNAQLIKDCHSTATPSVSTAKSSRHSRFLRDYEPHLRLY